MADHFSAFFFSQLQGAIDFLYPRLANSEMSRSRPVYQLKTPDSAIYSVITQAR